jgi:hypothetical protein
VPVAAALLLPGFLATAAGLESAGGWLAGAAEVKITPEQPVGMFGARGMAYHR